MRAMNIAWLTAAAPLEHLYKHRWLGERFFHLPGDMIALQEILVSVKPGLVIHSGVAAGGGPVFLASILELIGGTSVVAAIDPKLRDEGRKACTEHAITGRGSYFAITIRGANGWPLSIIAVAVAVWIGLLLGFQ